MNRGGRWRIVMALGADTGDNAPQGRRAPVANPGPWLVGAFEEGFQ